MGRLRALPGRLGTLPARLVSADAGKTRDALRYRDRPSRKWMNTAAWRRLRWEVIEAASFTCQWPGCGRTEASRNLVADHRAPHRDDPALFWDRANLWCLCKTCHDSKKQREERRTEG